MEGPLVVFCADPFDRRQPDATYVDEVAATQAAGFAQALIGYEALVDEDNAARAVGGVELRSEPTLAIYRGWMMRPYHYEQLHAALAARNVYLINSSAQYRHVHYLPESYDVIEGHTPPSAWLPTGPGVSIDAVMNLLRPFGDRPVILKDYVKSQKHHWAEACYIPSAADRVAVERVVRRFLELQGADLNEGLVFRAFLDLEPLAVHSKSGMPLYTVRYWDEGDYGRDAPPPDLFQDVAAAVRSRFFTMDVARRRDGSWIIVELGDGQVAGLPDSADPVTLYAGLKARLAPEYA